MPSIRSFLIRLYIKHSLKKIAGLSFLEARKLRDESGDIFKIAPGVSKVDILINTFKAEWLIPDNEISDSAILYLHGGAYVLGSLRTHRGLASHIAKAGRTRVLLIDYRLAPENPYPAALDDALTAYKWIQETTGLPTNRIIIAGDSAGGGLALATAIRLRESGQALPRALICLSPWTDLTFSGTSINSQLKQDPFFSSTDQLQMAASAYAGEHDLSNPEISPRLANYQGLPEIFIQVGSDEILLSDSIDLVSIAQKSGTKISVDVWPGMWHVWQVFHGVMPESKKAIESIGEKIKFFLDDSHR
ncbi:MAG: alpha/beta hydrolase [Pseudomonas sp.]|uniref:alpha/beta hydrolase n=1 Tax=Pseudomonas sp. FEMGT703P TaxID=2080764 RepID=UPI000CA8E35F|nr:alpha/beta hydrolase [Pseudomonas sp. FEMGT703P]PJE43118.1 MAG: alpha/beta hydrolase [Pseudomonas sp.] [Pseudomonas sp. FEMGT703P]